MGIIYSRHASQRVKLYQIDSEEIDHRLAEMDLDSLPLNEKRTFIFEGVRSKAAKPIKVVLVKERSEIVIVTIYPVKRGIQL